MSFRVPNQPRQPGSELIRELCFGVDAGQAASRAELQEVLVLVAESAGSNLATAMQEFERHAETQAVRATASTIARQAHVLASVGNVLANRDLDSPFRVVLMGRTMAGKSTLFEYLTGGSGARIGVGGQRTTRDASARPLRDLVGVEVVDTPGVGAMDGSEDFEKAFAEVPEADLVLWVATDQATQELTGRALQRLADLGKPILVALNCLADIRDDINFADLLEDPDRIFGGDAEGNLAPIRRHLQSAGGRYLDVVAVHAQAAQLSTSGTYSEVDSKKLLRSSRIGRLLEAIRFQRDHTASARRLVSLADIVRYALLETAAEVEASRVELSALLAAVRGSHSDFGRRARRRILDAHSELSAVFAAAITERERWIERIDVDMSDKQINQAWNDELKAIQGELHSSAANVAMRLSADLRLMATDVSDDWSEISTHDFRELGGIGDLWGNRVVRVGGRIGVALVAGWGGVKLGAMVGAAFAGPPGAAIGATLGGAIAGVVAGVLGSRGIDWIADRLFRNATEVHDRRRERVHAQLGPILANLTEKAADAREALRDAWIDALEVELQRQSSAGDEVEALLDRLARLLSDELESAITAVDTKLARQLLRSSGRPRAAEALTSATRWRGAGMAVELPAGAFTEMVLFPMPDDVERIVPTRAEAPPEMNALQIIRTLADREVLVHKMSRSGIAVSLGSSMAEGRREAMESLARVHAATHVRIADSIEGDTGDQGSDPRVA